MELRWLADAVLIVIAVVGTASVCRGYYRRKYGK